MTPRDAAITESTRMSVSLTLTLAAMVFAAGAITTKVLSHESALTKALERLAEVEMRVTAIESRER